jgi:hypothetical protein
MDARPRRTLPIRPPRSSLTTERVHERFELGRGKDGAEGDE